MAIRNITVRGDEILTKKCKPVKEITPHIKAGDGGYGGDHEEG